MFSVLTAAFTHVLSQLESKVFWCFRGLAVMRFKIGHDRLEKLGLSHRHMSYLMIALC